MKNVGFLSEDFKFYVVKFSIYLNMRVFVMVWCVTGIVSGLKVWTTCP